MTRVSMHSFVRRHALDTGIDQGVEFASLLDPIRAAPVPVSPIGASPVAELVAVPVAVSRFADAGADDDRLPLRTPTRRLRLR